MTTELIAEVSAITVSSNFDAFAAYTRQRLAEMKTDLRTDADFDEASDQLKLLTATKDGLKKCRDNIMANAGDLNTLVESLKSLESEVASVILTQKKQITARRDAIRAEIIEDALKSFGITDLHLVRREFRAILEAAAKGKRSTDTARQAVEDAAAGIRANIESAREIITDAIDAHGPDMFPDFVEMSLRGPAMAQAEIRRRVDLKAQREQSQAQIEVERAAALAFGPRVDTPPWENVQPQPAAKESQPEPAFTLASEESETEEFARMKSTVREAFAPIKAMRETLKHDANKAKIAAFADAVGAAWKQLNA